MCVCVLCVRNVCVYMSDTMYVDCDVIRLLLIDMYYFYMQIFSEINRDESRLITPNIKVCKYTFILQ